MLSYLKSCFLFFAVVSIGECFVDEGQEAWDVDRHAAAKQAMMEEPEQKEDEPDHIYLERVARISRIGSLFPLMDDDRDGGLSMPEIANFFFRVERESAVKMTPEYMESIQSAEKGKFTLEELSPQMSQAETSGDRMGKDMGELQVVKFNAADLNKDGVLSEEELPFYYHPAGHPDVLALVSAINRKFLDTDGDGSLTKSEFHGEDGVSEKKVSFDHLDKDGDGNVNATELQPYVSGQHHIDKDFGELFDLADTDGDKKLTKDEIIDASHHRLLAHDHMKGWADHFEL